MVGHHADDGLVAVHNREVTRQDQDPEQRPRVRALHLLRFLFAALTLSAAAALPFELGALPLPAFLQPPPSVVSINNSPRTAVVGHTETFSARLAGSAHAALTYILVYPAKHTAVAHVRANTTGYSSRIFHLDGYRPRHWRESALIGIKDASGAVKAVLPFAIQDNGHKPRGRGRHHRK